MTLGSFGRYKLSTSWEAEHVSNLVLSPYILAQVLTSIISGRLG